jgi:hypothetical protein
MGLVRAVAGSVVVLSVLTTTAANAEQARRAELLLLDAPRADSELEPLRRWLRTQDVELVAQGKMGVAHAPRHQVDVLSRVEDALAAARSQAARLDERGALLTLLEAERLLMDQLTLPGVERWLAEVFVQAALVAYSLGEDAFAETQLTRAASLDPTRRVGAAEAPPQVVTRAEQVVRAGATATTSRFRIVPTPDTAELWLDGSPLGVGPREVSIPKGPHLLQARSPGHAPYATLLVAQPGDRAPVQLVLSKTREQFLREALAAPGLTLPDAGRLARTLAAEVAHDVCIARLGSAARASLVRCDAERCAEPVALSWAGADANAIASARPVPPHEQATWLSTMSQQRLPHTTARPRARHRHWAWWAAGGAGVVGAVLLASLLRAQPEPEPERKLVIDPGPITP